MTRRENERGWGYVCVALAFETKPESSLRRIWQDHVSGLVTCVWYGTRCKNQIKIKIKNEMKDLAKEKPKTK